MLGLALHRLLGRYFYALLVLVAIIQRPLNFKHYAAGVLIFAVGLGGYLAYRQHVLGDPPSILGEQVFQNIYLELAAFGYPLTPNIGPYTKQVLKNVHDGLLPSPAQSPLLKNGPSSPEFMKENFYKYSADELFKIIFEQPNFEYQLYIFGRNSDKLLLHTSVEVAMARPLFVLKYTLRNFWDLLYDPGWGHGRFTTLPRGRSGLTFPMGGPSSRSMGDTIGERAPPRALKELQFIPLVRAPAFVRDLYFVTVDLWHESYLTLSKIFFGLMVVTWISTVIGLLARLQRWPKLRRWSRIWLSEKVIDLSLGMSILLLANVGITALLVDPQFRYDFSLLPFKIMLSGIGACVLLRLLFRFEPRVSFRLAHVALWPHRLMARAAACFEELSDSAPSGGINWTWRGVLPMAVALCRAFGRRISASGCGKLIDLRCACRRRARFTSKALNAEDLITLPRYRWFVLLAPASDDARSCSIRAIFTAGLVKIVSASEWTCSKAGLRHEVSSPLEPRPGTEIRMSCE